MFRRMISMLLIGSLVIVGNDALASNGTVSARDARANERNKRTRESEQPAHEQPAPEQQAPVQPARKRGKKTPAGVVGGGVVQQVVPPKVVVVSDLSPALKTAFTKAGVKNPEERNRLMGIVGGVKARQGQQAAQPVFTDKDLIDLLQNPKTIGELHDGAVEAVKIIDIVIAKRTWKHLAPVADVLEAIRPQLVGFHGFIEAKIARGEWTLATPVDSVDSQPAEQVVEVVHCPGIGTKETAAVETHEPVLLRKKEEATPWVTRGTATAVAGTVVCFVVAGVTMPIFVPTMAVNTAIGAGFGAFFSAGTSLLNEEGCAGVAKSMLHGAAHGALGGALKSGIGVLVPTDFLGSAITEHAFEGALAGFVTGGVHGIDNSKILGQALMGGALGGAFGAVYGSYQELRRYITSLQQALDQSQQALAQSQAQVAQLEGELRAALEAGAIDKEAASQYIGQLRDNLEQAVAENTEILGRLSQADALTGQQAATIAEQQAVITGQQTAAGMLQQEIEKNMAMIPGLRSEAERQLAVKQELVGRVVGLEQHVSGLEQAAIVDGTALLECQGSMEVCTGKLGSSCPPVRTVLDPLYEFTGATALGRCVKDGSGSEACISYVDAFYRATGAKAAGDWAKSFWG